MAFILKPTGEGYPVMPDFGRPDFTVLQMQAFIHAETFEVIPVRWIGKDVFIVTDEEGFLNKRPFNPQASREARRAVYGDVLIVKHEELGGKEDM